MDQETSQSSETHKMAGVYGERHEVELEEKLGRDRPPHELQDVAQRVLQVADEALLATLE
jgi:hypothetical protein